MNVLFICCHTITQRHLKVQCMNMTSCVYQMLSKLKKEDEVKGNEDEREQERKKKRKKERSKQ